MSCSSCIRRGEVGHGKGKPKLGFRGLGYRLGAVSCSRTGMVGHHAAWFCSMSLYQYVPFCW